MTLFIIPGFQQKITDPAWLQIQKLAQNYAFTVVMVQPTWSRHTLKEWVANFAHIRQKYPEPHYLLGFSFGAMIALVSAAEQPVQQLILCSLSPYFQEDIPRVRPWWKQALGKKRMAVFAQTPFKSLAATIDAHTWLLIGENEVIECKHRFQKALKVKPQWHGMIVPSAGHSIEHAQYQNSLKQVFETITKH